MLKRTAPLLLLALIALLFAPTLACSVGTGGFYPAPRGRQPNLAPSVAELRIINDTAETLYYSYYNVSGDVAGVSPVEIIPGATQLTTVPADRVIHMTVYRQGEEGSPLHEADAQFQAQWRYEIKLRTVTGIN